MEPRRKGKGKYYLGWSDTKNPPFWEPSLERVYPFRRWKKGVALLHLGTELSDELVGPSIARRLGGFAADLVCSLNGDLLRSGHINAVTGAHVTGVSLRLQALQDDMTSSQSRRPPQRSSRCSSSVGTARRASTIRSAATRTSAHKSNMWRWGFDLPHTAAYWILMEALRIPKSSWPLLLQPFGGTFSTHEEAMLALMTQIRQQGHTMEAGSFQRPGGDCTMVTSLGTTTFPKSRTHPTPMSLTSTSKVGARHAPSAGHTSATTMATTTAAPHRPSATTLRRRRLTNSLLVSPLPRRTMRRPCGTPTGLLGGAIVRLPPRSLHATNRAEMICLQRHAVYRLAIPCRRQGCPNEG